MAKHTFQHIISLLFFITISLNYTYGETVTAYAKQGDRVFLELEWNATNHGDIQWQTSSNEGKTWTNIRSANTPFYELMVSRDSYIRAKVETQEECQPFYATRIIRTVNFTTELQEVGSNKANFKISNFDFEDAEIVEYGFSYNFASLSTRSFENLYRTAVKQDLPESDNFNMICADLQANTSYVFRIYFKTSDGSTLFSPSMNVRTLSGPVWSSEDWTISKNELEARFKIDGTAVSNDNIKLKFGLSSRQLQDIKFSKVSNNVYASELLNNLTPNTNYVFQLEVQYIDKTETITKTIRTLSDYSAIAVDNTIKPVKHTIQWDRNRALNSISPAGLQTEYPRILRVSEDTLLCSYHGGHDNDYWLNIYLQRSYDNGQTWTNPTMLWDKEHSIFGKDYWRLVNPELLKLQNGWLLMSFIGNGRPETNENCHVMVSISKDNGDTWGDPIIVGRGRTWEPMVIQLPNGELELYVASEAAWWGNSPIHQEILFSRSTDNGETWNAFKRAAYSPERRDGMPVAIVMQGNKGILFAIEIVNDHGWGSPSLVKRNLKDEWDANPWSGINSSNRWRVNMNAHGGAPYMIQLPTGEIVVSAHTHGKTVWQTSTPSVAIGDNSGRNFTSPVRPITNLPDNQGLYYNSLFLKDDETIWLVMTHSTYNGDKRIKGEIKYLEGKIVKTGR